MRTQHPGSAALTKREILAGSVVGALVLVGVVWYQLDRPLRSPEPAPSTVRCLPKTVARQVRDGRSAAELKRLKSLLDANKPITLQDLTRLVGAQYSYCHSPAGKGIVDRSKRHAVWAFAKVRTASEPLYRAAYEPSDVGNDALRTLVSDCTPGAHVLWYWVAEPDKYEQCEPPNYLWDGTPLD